MRAQTRMQICSCPAIRRREARQRATGCREFVIEIRLPTNNAPPYCTAHRSFVARDQALATAIPAAHDALCKFRFR